MLVEDPPSCFTPPHVYFNVHGAAFILSIKTNTINLLCGLNLYQNNCWKQKGEY